MATGGRHFKPSGAAPQPNTTSMGGAAASQNRGSHAASPPRQMSHDTAPQNRATYNAAPSSGARVSQPIRPPRVAQASPYARPQGSTGTRGGRPGSTSSAPRPRRGRNIASYVLIAIGVVLLLVAGGLFVHAQIGYKQAADFYDGLTKEAVTLSDEGGDGVPVIDFDALKKVNEDVVGWIYIPGTNINYVVVQGKTNDTYLRTLISGDYNANGTVFLDSEGTAPGLVDQQTTLYGHHMNDGSMFTQVYDSLDQEKFDSIEKVYYITPEKTYELKPLFTMRVDDDYVEARQTSFEGDGGLAQYLSDSIKHAEAKATDADTELSNATKVLTLVTCDDAFLAQTKRAAMVCTLIAEYDTVQP